MKHMTIGAQAGDNTRILSAMPYELDKSFPHTGDTNKAVYVDIETTGLEVKDGAEITSLSWIKFEFTDTEPFRVVKVISSGTMLNEPNIEPSDENILITGLTMDKLRGHKITWDDYGEVFNDCEVVIAHGAKFDRQFIDKFYKNLVWGCSLVDVDWRKQYLLPSNSLPVMLAYLRNEYFDHHNSEADAWAGLHILNYRDGDFEPFDELIKNVFAKTYHLIVAKSPFEAKDYLKGLKMQWDPLGKYWHKDNLKESDMLEMRDKIIEYLGDSDNLMINPKGLYERLT